MTGGWQYTISIDGITYMSLTLEPRNRQVMFKVTTSIVHIPQLGNPNDAP